MTEWKTDISSSGEDSVVRGVPREEVMEMDFSDAIWLTLTGEKPSGPESEVFRTILSSSIDHGVGNPSTVSARTVQSGGNDMNSSVAGGILALGDSHGGAIEGCMEMLQNDSKAEDIIDERLSNDEKIPGLGHKVYDDEDPRASKILEVAGNEGLSGEYVEKMKEIKNVFADRKVELVMNVDGAIGAVASDMGMAPELGKGLFIISRTPGLVAHVREEMDRENFRREEGEYTGEE